MLLKGLKLNEIRLLARYLINVHLVKDDIVRNYISVHRIVGLYKSPTIMPIISEQELEVIISF